METPKARVPETAAQPVEIAKVSPEPAARPASIASATGAAKAKSFYLQLGAFTTEDVARDFTKRLSKSYPVEILSPAGKEGALYKVVIGPLNKAESGTLLTLFQNSGFPGAFLRALE